MTKVTMPDPDIFDGVRLDGSIASHAHSPANMEAYADARMREALKTLDRKLDEAFSKLQSYDKADDFWEGVGYSAHSATQIINACIAGLSKKPGSG